MSSALDLVVRAPRAVVDGRERPAAIAVRSGVIAAITAMDAPLSAEKNVLLGADEVLLPGLVDSHVHVNDPGRSEWEGFVSATRAAAAGGVTTVIDMPLNSIPPTCDVAALELKRRAAEVALVDVGFWGGVVPGNLGSLGPLAEAGVWGFKCFLLDSGVEEFPALSPADLVPAMREIAALDSLLIVHAEDAETIAAAPAPTGHSYARFLASRPPAAENRAIATVIDAARRTGCRTHIAHLSSSQALPALAEARAEGVPITVETCPHYLSLDADQIPDGATQFKCCPPIRDGANRAALWAGLASGVIDCVVSDHSPATVELKHADDGDFASAWGGISSLQVALSVVWTAAREQGFHPVDLAGWMAAGSARVVGLPGKGRLEVGADADLCVFAPDEQYVVDAGALHHRHPVTPYDGRRLRGVVRSTWLRGVQIGERSTVIGQPGAGCHLMREIR